MISTNNLLRTLFFFVFASVVCVLGAAIALPFGIAVHDTAIVIAFAIMTGGFAAAALLTLVLTARRLF